MAKKKEMPKNKKAMKKGVDPKKVKSKGDSSKSSSKTSSATKTATSTKTSTDAYTQGNITVTGGAGAGATKVNIAIPGLSADKAKKPSKAKGK